MGRRMSASALLLCAPFLSACQEASFVSSNPLFLQCFLGGPTVEIGTRGTVVLQRVAYKDIDKGIVDYGDDVVQSTRKEIWEFQSGRLVRMSIETSNELGVFVEPVMTVDYPSGRIVVTNYTDQGEQLTDEYRASQHDIVLVSTGGAGGLGGFLEMGEGVYRYWDSASGHSKRPEAPDMEYRVDGNTLQVTEWRVSRVVSWKLVYVDGVLMTNERGNGPRLAYSTFTGLGQVVVSDTNGRETERWHLERETDERGRLVREKVRRADGTGYIYIIERRQ